MALVKDVAKEAAERVLRANWDGRLPVDPVRIAEQLGLQVFVAKLDGNTSGKIVKEEHGAARIYLDRDEHGARQNFTCAHELGHWQERLDRGDHEFSFVDKRGEGPMNASEWYAEHFAGNLLMPAREFIDRFDAGYSDGKLANCFAVSVPAVRSRMRNLGLRRDWEL